MVNIYNSLKITNNTLSKLEAASNYISGNIDAIKVTGNNSISNPCIISSNNIQKANNSGPIYNNGINIATLSANVTGNNISNFNANGIFSARSDGYVGIISNNIISRGTTTVTSYISGIEGGTSSALVVDNYLDKDTVDGGTGNSSYTNTIKYRGSNWVVERNINQTEFVTVPFSIGQYSVSNNQNRFEFLSSNNIDVLDTGRYSITANSNGLTFTFDNKFVGERNINFMLLDQNGAIYNGLVSRGKDPLDGGLGVINAVWSVDDGVCDISGDGSINNTKKPVQTVAGNLAGVTLSTIYDYAQYQLYPLYLTSYLDPKPSKMKIYGSSVNDGVYDFTITGEFSGTLTRPKDNKYYSWLINLASLLPSGVKVESVDAKLNEYTDSPGSDPGNASFALAILDENLNFAAPTQAVPAAMNATLNISPSNIRNIKPYAIVMNLSIVGSNSTIVSRFNPITIKYKW